MSTQLSYALRTFLYSWKNEALSNVTDTQANLFHLLNLIIY